MQNITDYFKQNKIEIVGLNFDKNENLEVLTKSHGIITEKEVSGLDELSMRQLKELKNEFPVAASPSQELILESAKEAKDNLNKNIYSFIKDIVNVKQSDEPPAPEKRMAELIDGIENQDLKNELLSVLEESHSTFEDTHRHLMDAIKTSYIDSLTGCLNGNYFQKYLGKGYDLFNRLSDISEYNSKLEMCNNVNANAICFYDLNNFKAVNDLVSHEIGDDILKKFAQEVNDFTNEIVLIRAGGDEFVALGDKKVLKDLETYLNSKEFIENLNENIPKEIEFCGKPLQSTVSKGIADLNFPKKVHNKDAIMLFKKDYNRAHSEAESLSGVDKKRIKSEMGVGEYRNSQEENTSVSESFFRSIRDKIKKKEDIPASEFSKIDFESEAFNSLDEATKEIITEYVTARSDAINARALEQNKQKSQDASIDPK